MKESGSPKHSLVGSVAFLMLAACGSGNSNNGSATSEVAANDVQAAEELYVGISLDLNRALSDADRQTVDRYASWFPGAKAVPPIISNGGLPGWFDIGTDDFSRLIYPSRSAPLKTDPHFYQFVEPIADYDNLGELLNYVNGQTGLSIDAGSLTDIEAYGSIFGDTLRAGFDSVDYKNQSIDYFIDILAQGSGEVIVNLVYAKKNVFDGWDAILLPLVMNGYIEDPGLFPSRDVFRAGSYEQKSAFYAAMVNTRVMSEFGSFVAISDGAQQAMDNAVTISGCAASSNCSISYVGGRAVADYNQ